MYELCIYALYIFYYLLFNQRYLTNIYNPIGFPEALSLLYILCKVPRCTFKSRHHYKLLQVFHCSSLTVTSRLTWSTGHHPRQRPLPPPHGPRFSLLLDHMAPGPPPIGRPVSGAALQAGDRLAPLALASRHLAAESGRLHLPGILLGEGQRSAGGPEGGSRAGGGASQWLPGHAGSVSGPVGHGSVAVGEHQPPRHWRWAETQRTRWTDEMFVRVLTVRCFSAADVLGLGPSIDCDFWLRCHRK